MAPMLSFLAARMLILSQYRGHAYELNDTYTAVDYLLMFNPNRNVLNAHDQISLVSTVILHPRCPWPPWASAKVNLCMVFIEYSASMAPFHP